MALAAAALIATAVLVGGPSAARTSQDPSLTASTTGVAVESTTTVTSAATTSEASDDTTTVTSGQTDQRTPDTSQIDEENRKFAFVVAGLVAVAVALALLTIRYWRVTKPSPIAVGGDEGDDGDEGDNVSRVVPRPSKTTTVELDDDELFVDVAAAEAAAVSAQPARPSRRAVAGADHADVDANWEPRATGEQERVSGQVRRVTNRPSASDRARAFEASDGP